VLLFYWIAMISTCSKLFRVRLALLNGMSALGGYCLFPAPVQMAHLMSAFCGVTLLAMGGSALNQVMERDIDAMMARTRCRPIPYGDISLSTATFAGVIAILLGCALLAATGGLLPPALGLAALVWYLAVYTPLKRRTSLALPLGAISGAVPPLIGWCLAGGILTDYRIIILAGLFFIWQIPHFWLLQRQHRTDYRSAGILLFPEKLESLPAPFLIYIWVLALLAAALMLPVLGVISQQYALWYAVLTLFPALSVLFCDTRILKGCYSAFPLVLTVIIVFQNYQSHGFCVQKNILPALITKKAARNPVHTAFFSLFDMSNADSTAVLRNFP
jgi:protoheme IX farnesyltransferase